MLLNTHCKRKHIQQKNIHGRIKSETLQNTNYAILHACFRNQFEYTIKKIFITHKEGKKQSNNIRKAKSKGCTV